MRQVKRDIQKGGRGKESKEREKNQEKQSSMGVLEWGCHWGNQDFLRGKHLPLLHLQVSRGSKMGPKMVD